MEEQNKYGIENLKKLMHLPLSLHMAYEAASADGKIDITDAGHLMTPVGALVPAVMSAEDAERESRDLTDEEKQELIDWAKGTYKIPNEKLEAKVEGALALAIQVLDFVHDVQA
ncbi:MAG: hypothetical protein CMB99_16005 [Flavobacteriaceae bacterium]|nr:hypothetical protein [Flavobacteriaceae bacterium]